MKKAMGLALLLIATILITYTAAVIVERWLIPSTGQLHYTVHLAHYVNGTKWTNGTVFDWGDFYPGSTSDANLTVENTGAIPITVWLNVENLHPNLTLTWTENNTYLLPTESAMGNVTVTVDPAHRHSPPGTVTLDFTKIICVDDGA